MNQVFYNHYDSPMKIVEIIDSAHVIVEFQDEYKARVKTIYEAVKKGNVKNPYDKTIVGVGYIGEGKYKSWEGNNPTVVYTTWMKILTRCYYPKTENIYKSYFEQCEVCEEWFNFQNFAKWYEKEFYHVDERLHIDKDILYPNCKFYSPETCILVPQRINMIFMNKQNKRGLPNGIYKEKHGYGARFNCVHLGTYGTVEDAYQKYAEEKEKHIEEIANEYKGIIPERVFDALMNYKVCIEYDKNYIKK